METIVERPAALDVRKAQVTACVRVPDAHGRREQHVAEFSTTVRGLLGLRDWLAAHELRASVYNRNTRPLWRGCRRPRAAKGHGTRPRVISFLRSRPRYGGELVSASSRTAWISRCPPARPRSARGREAHVDLLSRCAPGVSMTTEIVVTSSLTSPER